MLGYLGQICNTFRSVTTSTRLPFITFLVLSGDAMASPSSPLKSMTHTDSVIDSHKIPDTVTGGEHQTFSSLYVVLGL